MIESKEIPGHCDCFICGAPNQEVRIGFNQELYVYCDNGCSFKLGVEESWKILPELRAGHNVRTSSGKVIFSNTANHDSESTKLPRKVIESKVSATSKLVYTIIANCSQSQSSCCTYNYIAEMLNVSRNTAIRAVKELVAAGFIQKEHKMSDDGGYVANRYTLI